MNNRTHSTLQGDAFSVASWIQLMDCKRTGESGYQRKPGDRQLQLSQQPSMNHARWRGVCGHAVEASRAMGAAVEVSLSFSYENKNRKMCTIWRVKCRGRCNEKAVNRLVERDNGTLQLFYKWKQSSDKN